MSDIFLASAGIKLGKTVAALGIASNHSGKIGYYKPFKETLIRMDDEMVDQDALLMSEMFDLEHGSRLSPFTYDIYDPVSMEDIVARHDELAEDDRLMIIEGGREPSTGFAHLVSNTDIAKELKVPLVVVATESRQSLDMIIVTKNLCDQKGLKMLGVIFNKASDVPRKFLESRGIKVLGEIPPIPELTTFRIPEMLDKMHAKVIAGIGGLDRVVETVLLGTMTIQSASEQMRRTKRKALVTGGDRTDLLIAALSTDTSCIIVTGGIRPSNTVLSRAEELDVPVIMTSEQTLRVAEILENMIGRIDPRDEDKIKAIKDGVRSGVDLDAILKR
ncbi:MAG: AAA family ATPase [Methanomassiliicoccaceae archaeon]|nr:AAA family ATPase [Methanomassiliicoccaceae archaeon]